VLSFFVCLQMRSEEQALAEEFFGGLQAAGKETPAAAAPGAAQGAGPGQGAGAAKTGTAPGDDWMRAARHGQPLDDVLASVQEGRAPRARQAGSNGVKNILIFPCWLWGRVAI
jgi:hypothetical protein